MSDNKKAKKPLKERISDALINLMSQKEFSKITINEITDAAGVNRSTWFRNFASKGEALTFKIVQLWYRWSDEHQLDRAKYTVYNAKEFFNFVYEYRCFIKQVLDLGLQSTVYEAFCEVMKPQFSTGAAECYRSRLYSYGLFGLLGEWNNRGYSETPDEMVNYYNKMMGIA